MSFGVTAAVVGGAAALGGAAIAANASKKAANSQRDAASQQAQLQYDQYQQSRQDQAPWRNVGSNALNELAMRLGIGGSGAASGGSLANASLVDTSSGIPMPNAELYATNDAYRRAWDDQLAAHQAGFGSGYTAYSDPSMLDTQLRARLGPEIAQASQAQQQNPLYGSLLKNFTAQDFQTDPGYQFRIGEGQKQIESSAAARGGLLSGAAAKALTKYNQDFASNEYGNVYNRFRTNQGDQFNRLASLAGIGQTATNQTQQAGQNYAANAGNALQYGGTARASGYAGQANALNAGLGGVAGAFANYNSPYTTAPSAYGYTGQGSLFGAPNSGGASGYGLSGVTGLNSGVNYNSNPYSSFGGSYGG